jgi:outer membrane protein assembly factor BamB
MCSLFCLGSVCARASDWPIARGDANGTAVSESKLPAKPEVLWEFKVSSAKAGFEGTPVVVNDRVFVGDFEGTMYAIDANTGKEIWSQKTKDGFVTSAGVQEDKVIIGDFNGQVYCFDAKSGQQLWSREIDQQVASGPSFFDGHALITSESGSMLAMSLTDGESKWTFATGDQLRSSAAVWNSYAILGGCDGRLHKIDLSLGSAQGDGFPLDAPTLATASIIGNLAIVPTQPGLVLAVDLATDKVLWRFADQSLSNDIRSSPAALGTVEDGAARGLAVVTTRNRRVIGLDLKDGTVLWNATLRKRSDGSPVICDGRAWVGAADGMVVAIDLKTGDETWSYQLAGQILASPAIANDKLIVATEKGSVVCFGKKPN